jgi:hypothetical protein
MSSDDFILSGDSGLVGNELLQNQSDDIGRKMFVIRKTVADKDFTLVEALQVYGVTAEEYVDYLVNEMMGTFDRNTAGLNSVQSKLLLSIELISRLYANIVSLDKDGAQIRAHFSKLREDLTTDKSITSSKDEDSSRSSKHIRATSKSSSSRGGFRATYLPRLLQLDQLLQNKITGTPQELAHKVGLSERSLYEYIRVLKEMGAPIVYSREKRTYYYQDDKGHFKVRFQSGEPQSDLPDKEE